MSLLCGATQLVAHGRIVGAGAERLHEQHTNVALASLRCCQQTKEKFIDSFHLCERIESILLQATETKQVRKEEHLLVRHANKCQHI